jgi:hypothetical protein
MVRGHGPDHEAGGQGTTCARATITDPPGAESPTVAETSASAPDDQVKRPQPGIVARARSVWSHGLQRPVGALRVVRGTALRTQPDGRPVFDPVRTPSVPGRSAGSCQEAASHREGPDGPTNVSRLTLVSLVVSNELHILSTELPSGIIGIEQLVAGEPTQHMAAYLLFDRSNRFWRQCRGLPELDRWARNTAFSARRRSNE